ncbi:hypothetical protein RQP46_002163 [Phenoliferia psychrophenolica]
MLRSAIKATLGRVPARVLPCTCSAQLGVGAGARAFSTSRPTWRIADDFVNMIETDAARPIPQVATISPTTGFTLVDGLVVPSPVIFLNGVVFLWDVAPPGETDWDGFTEEKWKLLEVVTPRPDILLVGTGKRGLFPPPKFKKYINSLGIQIDVLDTRNACSTYNLLAEEGRRVAAALYPVGPLDARTGLSWRRE